MVRSDRVCKTPQRAALLAACAVLLALPATPRAGTPDLPELTPPWNVAASPAVPSSTSASAAAPFILPTVGAARDRAVDCLTSAVYYEAATEPREGQEAVAQVVLNRVKHPAFPKTVCGVVYQGAERTNLGCQFTFTCDGSLDRRPVAWRWAQAREVAEAALTGHVAADVGESTHYHAAWVNPYWRSTMVETRRIGAHIFYRLPGATTLSGQYGGDELQIPRSPIGSAKPRSFASGAARNARRAPPAVAADGAFKIWGLEVARVSARGGKVVVLDAS